MSDLVGRDLLHGAGQVIAGPRCVAEVFSQHAGSNEHATSLFLLFGPVGVACYRILRSALDRCVLSLETGILLESLQ